MLVYGAKFEKSQARDAKTRLTNEDNFRTPLHFPTIGVCEMMKRSSLCSIVLVFASIGFATNVFAQGNSQKKETSTVERIVLYARTVVGEFIEFDVVDKDAAIREPLTIPQGKTLVVTDMVADGAACPVVSGDFSSVVIANACVLTAPDPAAVGGQFVTRFYPATELTHHVNLTTGIEFTPACPPLVNSECAEMQVWVYGLLE
jgi:hypothetical protein